jgi:prevent-host-death family protein
MAKLSLKIDLQHGVVPVSRAASALAALIKRSNATGKPIIITQKGYPTGVLLSIELYTALQTFVNQEATANNEELLTKPKAFATDAAVSIEVDTISMAEPTTKRRSRRSSENKVV